MSDKGRQFVRCWSRIVTARGEPNHIEAGDKTVCGIQIGQYWDFELDTDLTQIKCLRCRKTKVFRDLEAKQ